MAIVKAVRAPATGIPNSIRIMRTHFSNEAQWRRFESERWRQAVRERGLKLKFLDREQQEPFFEALALPLVWRGYRATGRWWQRVPRPVRKCATIVLLFGLGYEARAWMPAAVHFAQHAMTLEMQGTAQEGAVQLLGNGN